MGTGIVSAALRLAGDETLSTILAVLAAAIWIMLALLYFGRALAVPKRFWRDATSPAALTAIAATGVVGTRLVLASWAAVGVALLIAAVGMWLALVPYVLRHWRTPTIGASFLLTVATESLALLSATIAESERAAWLAYAALVPFCVGLGFYLFVLSRFEFRQLAIGRGDHWVTGGALAISTLTAARLTVLAQGFATLAGFHAGLRVVSLVLWCLTMMWLPPLLAAEILRPRFGYSVERWATVFPLGMYCTCSFLVGSVAGSSAITDFARLEVWVALAVWLVVFLGMLGQAPVLARVRAGEAE
jgi:tellurite resistance protein TehA-like permease